MVMLSRVFILSIYAYSYNDTHHKKIFVYIKFRATFAAMAIKKHTKTAKKHP